MKQLIRSLASLRLTVALLVMALILIFLGTLAQVKMGVWEAVATYFRAPIAMVDPSLVLPGVEVPTWLRIPIPGGMLIAGLMIINLLAAHLARFRFTAARVGIIALHGGLIILLAGEFVTGFFSQEGLMRIDVGGHSSFVEDLRSAELAVIDPSNPEYDEVISIPGRMIERAANSGERVSHENLPFDIEVIHWYSNARLLKARGEVIADQGFGRNAVAEPLSQVAGVNGGTADAPAAYVKLYQHNELLGTWLLSADFLDAQSVMVEGQEYGLSLRFKRTYKPYRLELIEFRHDKFVGTQIARNFSSRVRLVDESHGTDREVTIWMNNPLRYRGATFYQASYKPDNSGTVLQVVENPGAALPYIASALVSGGMIWHFIWILLGYLRRETKKIPATEPETTESKSAAANLRSYSPILVGVIGMIVISIGVFSAPPSSEFDLDGFGKIPVSSGGRIKPMDSAARHLVSVASGRQSIKTSDGKMPAIQYLLDLIAQPETIRDIPIIRVDHPGVLALMNLSPEDADRLSFGTIEPHWDLVQTQAQAAASVPSTDRDAFQKAVLTLHSQVLELLEHAALEKPYGIPPLGPDEDWAPFAQVFGENLSMEETHPAVAYQVSMLTAWNEGDSSAFNQSVSNYLELLKRDMPEAMRKVRLEVLFNHAKPFYSAMILYILAFLSICFGLLIRMKNEKAGGWSDGLRRSGVALLWAAVLIHTLALILRIYLLDRPPVTNLYSSAIFVGWASVLLGLVLEHLHRFSVAAIGASCIGFATLVIAHNFGADGDTMQMMQAVLDSNFWLATHVITVTLGYSATFLAGTLAGIYLIMNAFFAKSLNAERKKSLFRMVYGTVCFALLLSFVGTVLGGIWADQSWGRFWGWDPKENGAALVVLINAIILHARWGGMIRERGVMVLAVFGNIVTCWSWFGTNMLGVGLHSYGFMSSAVAWMSLFVMSQLAIMSVGMINAKKTAKTIE